MHLQKVDVGHGEPGTIKGNGGRVGGSLEQLRTRIEGRERVAAHVAERLQPQLARPRRRHEQDGRGPVGQGRRGARGHRAEPAVEYGTECGQRFHRGVRPDAVVPFHDVVVARWHVYRGNLRGKPPVLGPGVRLAVRFERPLVLVLAGDPVLLGHALGRRAHGLAGRILGDRGRHRGQIARAQRGERAEAGPKALRPAGRHQNPGKAIGRENGDSGQAFGAARDDDICDAGFDQVDAIGDGLVSRRTRTRHGRGRNILRQRGQPDFTGDIRRLGIVDDRTIDELVYQVGFNPGARQQLRHRVAAEFDCGQTREMGARPGERGAATGNDGSLHW